MYIHICTHVYVHIVPIKVRRCHVYIHIHAYIYAFMYVFIYMNTSLCIYVCSQDNKELNKINKVTTLQVHDAKKPRTL